MFWHTGMQTCTLMVPVIDYLVVWLWQRRKDYFLTLLILWTSSFIWNLPFHSPTCSTADLTLGCFSISRDCSHCMPHNYYLTHLCHLEHSYEVWTIYYKDQESQKSSINSKVRKSLKTFECQTSSIRILIWRPLSVGIIVVDFFNFVNEL